MRHRRGRPALVPRPRHACRCRGTCRIARAKAVVGLCPITEANLGDGLFDVPSFLAAGGRFGVGSDSNVRISAADELRTLEYGQRLIHRQRNVLGDPTQSTGRRLFELALAGGAQAVGGAVGALAVGNRADFVVLDVHRFPARRRHARSVAVRCRQRGDTVGLHRRHRGSAMDATCQVSGARATLCTHTSPLAIGLGGFQTLVCEKAAREGCIC